MITTTPVANSSRHHHNRDASLPSRPTTPLRPASRTSLRTSQTTPSANAPHDNTIGGHDAPLDRIEPAFAELSDAMADLNANFMHLQLLNESIARFNENFASFLYGLNMTAFCVDFPEAPIAQSFARHSQDTNRFEQMQQFHPTSSEEAQMLDIATDATFMTGDTSFIENPPMSSKPQNRLISNAGRARRGATATRGSTSSRGATASNRGRAPVAGTDEYGRRTTRLPSGSRGRGTTTTTTTTARGRGTFSRQ